jgi:3-deoxy-7-phosphoheptulonate synthase
MIIVLKPDAKKEQIDHIVESIHEWGLEADVSHGSEQTIIGIIGDESLVRAKPLAAFPGVDNVMRVQKPYKRASIEFRTERTQIVIPPVRPGCREVVIGGNEVVVIAGPCSVEGREMLRNIGRHIQNSGAKILRAGAFKPRSSPYAFQGLGVKGIRYLADVRMELGIPIITEVMDTRDVELIAKFSDIVQVGARNMQNFSLLKVLGSIDKPVLLKRGLSNTIEELMMSAEYIMSSGNERVILCERGIRTFETYTRNTLDLSAVAVIKKESHLPVLLDPSHGTGHWDLVGPMSLAGVAVGADGLMIEVHHKPEEALSDGPQSLLPKTFDNVMHELKKVAVAVGRSIGN